MTSKGKNSDTLKLENSRLVIKLITLNNSISRKDIACSTGLSKMTVTNIVAKLIDDGVVTEVCEDEGNISAGRRKVFLDISPKAPLICGITISRDKCKIALMGLKLNMVSFSEFNICDFGDNATFIKKLLLEYDNIIKTTTNEILCIGISCIGPIDSKGGKILSPLNFYEIKNLDICDIIKNHTKKHVFIDNDMNTSAIAENLFGFAHGKQNFLYIGVTNGIGAGIYSNGQLQTGQYGFAGEIGHICVDYSGDLCSCGNIGCLESYASIPLICTKISNSLQIDDFAFNQIDQYTQNKAVDEILNKMCEKLSLGLTMMCNVLDPEIIYLGHDGFFIPEKYIKIIETYINSHIFAKGQKCVKVAKSAFNQRSPLIGSVAMVVDKIFSGQINIKQTKEILTF